MDNKLTDLELLTKLGMKEGLINKLKPDSIKLLAGFASDNTKLNNLLPVLIQIASIEAQNKEGAIYLMVNNLATALQLKNLSSSQILELVEDHHFNQDTASTIKNVKKYLVTQQQQKMFTKTDGVKGEFMVDPQEKEKIN